MTDTCHLDGKHTCAGRVHVCSTCDGEPGLELCPRCLDKGGMVECRDCRGTGSHLAYKRRSRFRQVVVDGEPTGNPCRTCKGSGTQSADLVDGAPTIDLAGILTSVPERPTIGGDLQAEA